MRKLEAPKIVPQIVRLIPRTGPEVDPEEARRQLAVAMEKRRQFLEAKSRELEAEMGIAPLATE
jgi:hypothetical protein